MRCNPRAVLAAIIDTIDEIKDDVMTFCTLKGVKGRDLHIESGFVMSKAWNDGPPWAETPWPAMASLTL